MATYSKAALMLHAEQTAKKYGLDPQIIIRQINQESGFNPNAKSKAGALGIAQIMPSTAKSWKVDPLDPIASIEAMCRESAKYLKTYKGDYSKMLAAYNAGPGAVAKYNGVPPYKETQNYVKNILQGSNPKLDNNSNPFYEGRVSKQGVNNNMSTNGIPQQPTVTQDQLDDLGNVVNQLLASGYTWAQIQTMWDNYKANASEAGANARAELGKTMNYLDNPIGPEVKDENGNIIQNTPRSIARSRENELLQKSQNAYNDFVNDISPYSAQAQAYNNKMYDRLNNAYQNYTNSLSEMYPSGDYYMDPDRYASELRSAAIRGEVPEWYATQQIARMRYETNIANKNGIPFDQYQELKKAAAGGNLQAAQAIQALSEKELGNRGTLATQMREASSKYQSNIEKALANTQDTLKLEAELAKTVGPEMAKTYIEIAKQQGTDLSTILGMVQNTQSNAVTGAVNVVNRNTQNVTDIQKQLLDNEGKENVANIQGNNSANVANIQGMNAIQLEQLKQQDPANYYKMVANLSTANNPYAIGGMQATKDMWEQMDPKLREKVLPGYKPGSGNLTINPPTIGHGQPTQVNTPTQPTKTTNSQITADQLRKYYGVR